ncbi:MAG: sulfurtransferase TusA family protein [Dehalococcoidia bacterium]|nr:sulfurtransferase TusA family protein [Dehalococcoidia bacterium]
MFELDCRGLSCPIPLVKLQKAIDSHPKEPILMKIDSETAQEHATRLAEGKGYAVKATRQGDDIALELRPGK